MRYLFFFVFLASTISLTAQHTISGTFSPAKDYKWLIAYHLKVGEQVYTVDTAIEKGKFNLTFPKNAALGTYRLVYAVPQEEFYFDVIYNGKEDVQLKFDSEKGVLITASVENKTFDAYLREINGAKQAFINFYQSGKTDKEEFKKLINRLKTTQKDYEIESEGLLVHQFITANRPYIPTEYETSKVYWQHKKDTYFDYIDVENPVLQNSGFLTDKLINYVFTAIKTDERTAAETEMMLRQNTDTVAKKLMPADANYNFQLFLALYEMAANTRFTATADHILDTFLKPLAKATDNQKIVDGLAIKNQLLIGAVPPEISWKDGDSDRNLSELTGSDNYILIFWSSTCPHCLAEIPPLHERLKRYPNVKTIAIGLEKDKKAWEKESAKLPDFNHVIALGQWDSRYAKLYNIQKTPSFFILDADKRILAKPDNDKEVVTFLDGIK